jgi:hypothetical protein
MKYVALLHFRILARVHSILIQQAGVERSRLSIYLRDMLLWHAIHRLTVIVTEGGSPRLTKSHCTNRAGGWDKLFFFLERN